MDEKIPSRKYTILASFNSLAYHLYDIEYKDYLFDCLGCPEEDSDFDELSNSVVTKLSDLKLEKNDIMKMEYDTGSTTTFNIIYLGSMKLKSYK